MKDSNLMFVRESDGALVENPIMRNCSVVEVPSLGEAKFCVVGGSTKFRYQGPAFSTETEAVLKTPFLSRAVRAGLVAWLAKKGLPTTLETPAPAAKKKEKAA